MADAKDPSLFQQLQEFKRLAGPHLSSPTSPTYSMAPELDEEAGARRRERYAGEEEASPVYDDDFVAEEPSPEQTAPPVVVVRKQSAYGKTGQPVHRRRGAF